MMTMCMFVRGLHKTCLETKPDKAPSDPSCGNVWILKRERTLNAEPDEVQHSIYKHSPSETSQ